MSSYVGLCSSSQQTLVNREQTHILKPQLPGRARLACLLLYGALTGLCWLHSVDENPVYRLIALPFCQVSGPLYLVIPETSIYGEKVYEIRDTYNGMGYEYWTIGLRLMGALSRP